MGRTARRRKRRKENFNCVGHQYKLFQEWILRQGWKQSVPLKIKHFSDTGHGLMAMEHIKCRDILVKIPTKLLITAKTVSDSFIGEIIRNKGVLVPIHLALTAFIMYQKHLSVSSEWSEYLSVLPASYSSPLFSNPEEFDLLPDFVVDKVNTTKKSIENMYTTLQSVCESHHCNHCSTPLSDIFRNDIFLWAWFAVNSRVVFISPSLNLSHSLPLSDSNSIALAPYLDMLNHSNSAKVVASFTPESGYELRTLTPFRRFEQVFIHYGDHDNLKLFIEYGFILPENENDVVMLCLNDITDQTKIISPIEPKLTLISQCCPEFLKDLYISQNGLSWNCKVLIYLLMETINLKLALHHVYTGNFEKRCSELKNISMIIIQEKIKKLRGYIEKLRSFKENNILEIGRQMLALYIRILENAKNILF